MTPFDRGRRRGARTPGAVLACVCLGLLPACVGGPAAERPTAGFARLKVPAIVQAPPPAEEVVSAFDERIDARLLPGAAPTPKRALPTVATGHAGARFLSAEAAHPAPSAPLVDVTPALAAVRDLELQRSADRQYRLVELSPWRSGIELFATQGLSLLVGSLSLVNESERDPVTIEHQRSAFEGDAVAVFGLRLRY
jgi:hypothetical protein